MASQENTVLTVETNTLETLFSAIKLNDYVSKSKSNKDKDISSLSSLIKKDLSHSDCIKLGTGLEKVLRDICSKSTKFKNIKPKNSKGKKEMDHLFISNNDNEHDTKKEIIYAEFKTNINLVLPRQSFLFKSLYLNHKLIIFSATLVSTGNPS